LTEKILLLEQIGARTPITWNAPEARLPEIHKSKVGDDRILEG
jgi:hypothetical protein